MRVNGRASGPLRTPRLLVVRSKYHIRLYLLQFQRGHYPHLSVIVVPRADVGGLARGGISAIRAYDQPSFDRRAVG